MHTVRSLALAVLILSTVSARADDDCDRPTADWQPRSAVEQLAGRSGWQIERLKVDDGCYEIRGRDADGRRFKAKLDPATLAVVSMKREQQSRDRDRDRSGQRDAPPDAATAEDRTEVD